MNFHLEDDLGVAFIAYGELMHNGALIHICLHYLTYAAHAQ